MTRTPDRPMKHPSLLPLICLTLGCSTAADDTGTEDTAETQALDTTYAADGFATCSGAASTDEIADNVLLTVEYGASLHEMVACGSLMVQLCSSITSGIITAILELRPHAMPEGWSYDGEGGYTIASESTTMVTWFYSTQDYTFAASGERITENVFLVDNYLSGIAIDIDWHTGETLLSYDEAGPLVELLGYGTTPDNPMSLSLDDLETVGDGLGSLAFDSSVRVEDVREYGTIGYNLETPQLEVAAFVGGAQLSYELVDADGARGDLEQSLVVEDWSIDFVGDSSDGALTGVSAYRVEGGHFDYRGEIHFDNSKVGETTLTCL